MVAAVAFGVAAAACEGDDSGNVMAASGTALTPAQVDAALGPEIADDPDSNGAATGNEAGNSVEETGNSVDSVNEAGPDNQQESAPANSDSNSVEQ